jgi:nucleotide-binding universal stress UspA family protein
MSKQHAMLTARRSRSTRNQPVTRVRGTFVVARGMTVARLRTMYDLRTIIVGTDFTPLGDLAVETAVELANDAAAQRVHVVHAVGVSLISVLGPVDIPSTSYALAFQAAMDRAQRGLEHLRPPPTNARITREARIGSPARELAAAATEIKADLSVVASHRRGRVGRFVLGSVSGTLIRAAPCPVLVVGEDRRLEPTLHDVVAAIDGSPISLAILEQAMMMAKKRSGRLHVVSVFDLRLYPPLFDQALDSDETYFRRKIEALVTRASARARGVDVDVAVVADTNSKQVILDFAEKRSAELLVIGTSGHNAWERMVLGSTATHVLADAPCPVLVVPSFKAE